MHWEDDAILLHVGKFSETSAIVTLYAAAHGMARGVVKGGLGRRQRGHLQTGNLIRVRWSARLAEHLGHLQIEPRLAVASLVLGDATKLAAATAICSLLHAISVERDPHPPLFRAAQELLAALADGQRGWVANYVRFELLLLQESGFGLDLTACVATGERGDLRYVSPKSGRAVSRVAGEPYRDRLLKLPDFLHGDDPGDVPPPAQILDGLRLTGYFLEHWLLSPNDRHLPAAALRLRQLLEARLSDQPANV